MVENGCRRAGGVRERVEERGGREERVVWYLADERGAAGHYHQAGVTLGVQEIQLSYMYMWVHTRNKGC